MVKYEIFDKNGARFALAPRFTCTTPARVFSELSSELIDKYISRRPETCTYKITRERSAVCPSFQEITFYKRFPSGERFKVVYTVPV